MPGHIDARTEKPHTFAKKPSAVAVEGRKAVRPHDAVTWDPRVVAHTHDVPDRARREWATREHSD